MRLLQNLSFAANFVVILFFDLSFISMPRTFFLKAILQQSLDESFGVNRAQKKVAYDYFNFIVSPVLI
jgi:hypothetical protein